MRRPERGSVREIFGLVVALAAGASSASASPTPAAGVTWHGVTLGMPVSDLRLRLGDPLRAVAFDNARRVARYWIPHAHALFFVIEDRGYVVGFRAESDSAPNAQVTGVPPDPSGVLIGDPLDGVKALHPDFHYDTPAGDRPTLSGRASPSVGVVYEFAGDRVQSFQWGMALAPGAPDRPDLVQPSGNSIADAILDVQTNESDGVDWEYVYLSYHPCDGTTRWALHQQSLMNEGGRAYDRLHVVCPTTKSERDFYFDITSYFGKL